MSARSEFERGLFKRPDLPDYTRLPWKLHEFYQKMQFAVVSQTLSSIGTTISLIVIRN